MSGTPDAKEDVVGRKDPSGGSPASVKTMAKEIGTLLGQSDWMRNLTAKRIGPVRYAVWSSRNGSLSQHVVNVKDCSCTCEDKQHNIQRSRGACAHIMYVGLRDEPESEHDSALLSVVAFASQDLARSADALRAAATSAQATHTPEATAPGVGESNTVSVTKAAEQLSEAFEEAGVSHPFEWTSDVTSEGDPRIWFAFDGKVPSALFKAYIQDPDAVWYQPDDSPDEDKPNSILVENVESYIENVLE